MKRTITLTARGEYTTTKVTVEVNTPKGYGRDDTTKLVLDVTDEIMGALGKKYRPSKIRIS